MLREQCDSYTHTRRSTKSWIQATYPAFEFEDGFTEKDGIWKVDIEEDDDQITRRQKAFLDHVFENLPEATVISATAHSGTIHYLNRVVRGPLVGLKPGDLAPLLVRRQVRR